MCPEQVDERGNKRPAQLVEITREPKDDMEWMWFEGFDKMFKKEERPDDDWPII